MAMTRITLVVVLLVFSSALHGQQKQGPESRDATDCNAQAHGYWDAPPEFWEKFWKECPPKQVGTLDGEPVYASRTDLRPTLKKGGVLPLPLGADRTSADVWLSVVISTAGHVVEATLVQSAGDVTLEEKAIQAVRAWRFKPATRNGKAVAVRNTVIVHFERTAG
jgi:TonB family protein